MRSRARTRPAASRASMSAPASCGPTFWERARYYNLERELAEALDKVNQ